MKISGVDFPIELLKALRDGELVVFAGAGVSMGVPACLPNFSRLAKQIAIGTGESRDKHDPEDRFLGWLHYKGVDVHIRAAQALSENGVKPLKPTRLHFDLLRLYPQCESLQLITTNFDLLFEQAAINVFGTDPTLYSAPLLPLGREFRGIVHLHGDVKSPANMVLTDADFGRAYLTDSWARRFLVALFTSCHVLFIGYSHSDVVMNYLARALPESAKKRYVLVPADENEKTQRKWQVLGIQRIEYPKLPCDNHQGLQEAISGLADFTQRNSLEWKSCITELAEQPPPDDEEQRDLIDYAFLDSELTRHFTAAETPPEWIRWLAERDDINGLFDTDRNYILSERDGHLSRWFAEKFARQHADQLFHLFGRHGMRIHPDLWYRLGRVIGDEIDPPIEPDTLSRWVSFFLSTPPQLSDQNHFAWSVWKNLGERCMEAGLIDGCIDIFELMAGGRLELDRPFAFRGSEDYTTEIRAERKPVCDHATINDLWVKAMKSKLGDVAEPLLSRVVEIFERRHRLLRAWKKASRTHDPFMWRRSSIAPPRESLSRKPFDVLIDAARDCLEHMMEHNPVLAASWCERLVRAEAPFLRKLAVYALTVRKDLSEKEKIDWLLRRIDIHDLPTENEMVPCLQSAYPYATPQQREAVIEAVLAYLWPNEDDEHKERGAAYVRFKWLHWLHQSDPKCTLAKQSLDKVWSEYPDFLPRDEPGAITWSEGGFIGHQSPWSVEELLARPSAEWSTELLSFRQTDPFGPDREGLRDVVKEAAAQDFEWSLQLADTFATKGNWQTDLWSSLMCSWCRELDREEYRRVLGYLNRPELHANHGRSVVEFLRALIRAEAVASAPELLSMSNRIAKEVGLHRDQIDLFPALHDWWSQAINSLAGELAQYWCESLETWRKQQEPTPQQIDQEYRSAFSDIIADATPAGTLGKAVLARYSPYLLEAHEQWTTTNLLPLFGCADDRPAYQAVWDGFLDSNKTTRLAELLKDAFLEAIPRLETHLPGEERREYFVRDFTSMLEYIVRDPTEILNDWIPTFFANTAEEDKVLFGHNLESRIERMEDAQQRKLWDRWLRRYLENRQQGVPAPLLPGEVGAILGWLPHFQSLFPDAVELAAKLPPQQLDHNHTMFRIKQGTLWETYPESVAALMVFLDRCTLAPYVWHFEGKELIDKLMEAGLTDDSKRSLLEISVRRGLSLEQDTS